MLFECIYSVQTQAYSNWEMCIVDDGSSKQETIDLLNKFAQEDKRIKLFLSPENNGICKATNQALAMTKGDYVAFLDHDDRIAPEAFFYVAKAIADNPEIDIVYSDRDMLSLRGLRFMHLFKPDWSPELLLSMNYICHLMVYRKNMVDKVGGIHHEFEGSQDYDLILRVMELNPVVHHIPKVLYHWRQNQDSVALNHDAKTYAYKAGVLALEHALKRRGLKGSVNELSDLWRGHYRVKLEPFSYDKTYLVSIPENLDADSYTSYINNKMQNIGNQEFIAFIGPDISNNDQIKSSDTNNHKNLRTNNSNDFNINNDNIKSAVQEMVSWFQIQDIGIVTGKVVDIKKQIIHAGIVQKKDGIPILIFENFDESEPGSVLKVGVKYCFYFGCA